MLAHHIDTNQACTMLLWPGTLRHLSLLCQAVLGALGHSPWRLTASSVAQHVDPRHSPATPRDILSTGHLFLVCPSPEGEVFTGPTLHLAHDPVQGALVNPCSHGHLGTVRGATS